MKATPWLCAGLLTLCGATLVAASPAFDAARAVSQAGINPIYMDYGDIKGSVELMGEVSGMFSGCAEWPPVVQVCESAGTLAEILDLAAEKNSIDLETKVQMPPQYINSEGFAASVSRALNNKHPELVKFAATGWGITDKRATSKFASLAKAPSFEGTQDQLIAILTGMIQANRTESVGSNEKLCVEVDEALAEEKQKWLDIQVEEIQ